MNANNSLLDAAQRPAFLPDFLLLTVVWSPSLTLFCRAAPACSQDRSTLKKPCVHAPPFVLQYSMQGKYLYDTKT